MAGLAAGSAHLVGLRGREVWRAVIVALPGKITTKEMSSTSYYIIKQTHEPIFRKDDGYNYTSKILKQWSRNIDYTRYTLCPDTSLLFDEALPFSFDLFKRHILEVTAKFDKSAIVRAEDSCLTVKFDKPSRRYMDFLSAYANSPTIEVSSMVEVGLGPFIVDSVAKDEITLRRKRSVSHGFNSIVVYDYKGAQDGRLKKIFISDYNFVSTRKGLELPESKYIRFENMSLKSMVLLINLTDQKQRRILYNCIDIDMLRKAFSPG
ncbi:MAG: hypothetical protein ACYC4Q_04710, partial [Victivallaceae bacterium]